MNGFKVNFHGEEKRVIEAKSIVKEMEDMEKEQKEIVGNLNYQNLWEALKQSIKTWN